MNVVPVSARESWLDDRADRQYRDGTRVGMAPGRPRDCSSVGVPLCGGSDARTDRRGADSDRLAGTGALHRLHCHRGVGVCRLAPRALDALWTIDLRQMGSDRRTVWTFGIYKPPAPPVSVPSSAGTCIT